jgi:hypothetical protein
LDFIHFMHQSWNLIFDGGEEVNVWPWKIRTTIKRNSIKITLKRAIIVFEVNECHLL